VSSSTRRSPAEAGSGTRTKAATGGSITLLDVDVTIVPVVGIPDLDGYFAGGAGALHNYGSANPLPLRA
jgi:hypothetical protein